MASHYISILQQYYHGLEMGADIFSVYQQKSTVPHQQKIFGTILQQYETFLLQVAQIIEEESGAQPKDANWLQQLLSYYAAMKINHIRTPEQLEAKSKHDFQLGYSKLNSFVIKNQTKLTHPHYQLLQKQVENNLQLGKSLGFLSYEE